MLPSKSTILALFDKHKNAKIFLVLIVGLAGVLYQAYTAVAIEDEALTIPEKHSELGPKNKAPLSSNYSNLDHHRYSSGDNMEGGLEAVARGRSEAGSLWIECLLKDIDLPPIGATLYSDSLSTLVFVEGDRLLLMPHYPDGDGVLLVDGYREVLVSWESVDENGGGTCFPEPINLEVGGTIIRGTVLNKSGNIEPNVWVTGCGGRTLSTVLGDYYMNVTPGDCVLTLARLDGLYQTRGEPVTVSLSEGVVLETDLIINEYPAGGIGIEIEVRQNGLFIKRVFPGSPAESAGLSDGNEIVSINGRSNGTRWYKDLVGESGTIVEVEVSFGRKTMTLLIERDHRVEYPGAIPGICY